MVSIQEEFIKLICDKTKSAEDIFNIMQSNHKELLSTRKIFRGMKSWSKCIYQGTIAENDFIVAEASSTALTQDSVEMIYDDYRETMIRFIEIFCEEYDKNPNEHIINIIIKLSVRFLKEVFAGASRNGDKTIIERNANSIFDEKRLLRKYNISSQKGEGKTAVCCERNVTIGNILQFVGFDTYHIAGMLYCKENDVNTAEIRHAFTLIKYGAGKGKYALFDIFNYTVVSNVLPGDYDLSQGFSIEHYDARDKKTYVYELEGPLYEMTDEILKIEIIMRDLGKRLEIAKIKYERNLEIDDRFNVELLKNELLSLLDAIQNSSMLSNLFKERYIKRINEYYMGIIEKIENNYLGHHSK